MSLVDYLKNFSVTIISVIIALILSRSGFGYLLILVAIGLIVSFITKRKRDAILTAVLYALVGYILSYPTGLLLADYMPSIEIPVETSPTVMIIDLLIGALIPICVAIIISGITSLIGANLAGYIFKTSDEDSHENNNYQVVFDNEENDESDYIELDNKEELLNYTPIHKAKLRKRQKEENEGFDD